MLEVVILGCGSSLGVPVISCSCAVCNSDIEYNKRTRSAILIQNTDTVVLVDFGFEIRQQLINAKVKNLTAAILTHDHADHVQGIDNLKVFAFNQKKPLEIFTNEVTALAIENRYSYMFKSKALETRIINFGDNIKIGSLEIQFFCQHHGPELDSLGIKIQDFVYSSDVSSFPLESEKFLYNLKTLVIDCRGYTSNPRHMGLEQVLEVNNKYKPQKLFLTNMGHEIDYIEIMKQLPENIIPLYDGYVIKLEN